MVIGELVSSHDSSSQYYIYLIMSNLCGVMSSSNFPRSAQMIAATDLIEVSFTSAVHSLDRWVNASGPTTVHEGFYPSIAETNDILIEFAF